MATNAEVLFKIKADTGKISSQLSKLEGQGKSIDNTFASSPFFTGAVAGIAMAGVNRIIDGLSNMGREAFTVSDQWTKLDMFMRTALNSGQKEIDDTIAMLKELAAKSIYSPDDMIQGFQRLKLAGVDAAEDIIKGFVDMAASMGTGSQGFQSFMTQFGQAVSVGKLQWGDLKIMMEQAPELVDGMAKAMGVTSAKFLIMAKDGDLSMSRIIKALQEGENGFKKFEGGATAAPKTFEAAWGAAEESIVNKISDIIDSLGKQGLIDTITNIADGIVSAFDKVQVLVQWMLDNKDAIKNFALGFTVFATALKGMSIISSVVAGVQALAAAESVLAVVQGVVAATNPFGWIGLAIAAVITLVALVIANWKTISKVGMDVGKTIATFFTGVFKSVKDFVVGVVSSVVDFIKGVLDVVLTILNPVIELVTGIFSVIFTIIEGFFKIALGMFRIFIGVIQIVLSPLINIFKLVFAAVTAVMQVFFNTAKGIFTAMVAVAKVALAPLITTFKAVTAAIKIILDTMAKSVLAVFKSIGQGIKNVFSSVVNFIKGIVNNIIGGINFMIDGLNLVSGHNKIARIKKLAHGGIATKEAPAIVGDGGPEAIVPLTPKGIAKFAGGLGLGAGSGETTYVFNITANNVDERSIENMMKRKAMAEGW